MLNSKLIKKVSEIEENTGEKLSSVLPKVPVNNVVKALKFIPTSYLIKMVKSVHLDKLIKGLNIITPKEIENISPDKLLIVLVDGNMETVKSLQEKYSEDEIIKAISDLSDEKLKELLTKDDFDKICLTIDEILK